MLVLVSLMVLVLMLVWCGVAGGGADGAGVDAVLAVMVGVGVDVAAVSIGSAGAGANEIARQRVHLSERLISTKTKCLIAAKLLTVPWVFSCTHRCYGQRTSRYEALPRGTNKIQKTKPKMARGG